MDPIAKKIRERVVLKDSRVDFTSSSDFPGSYPGVDDSWNLDQFRENLKIDAVHIEGDSLEFDLVGVDAAIANTLRRILIAEVPTIAIESVYVMKNNSIMADEIFAHRLGLIPLKVDPRLLTYKADDGGEATDANTIVLSLDVECKHKTKPRADAVTAEDKYDNAVIYSRDLVFVPQGNQTESLGEVRPVHDDIVIMKLRPGQAVEMQLHCEKGIGKVHSKWSPVATASYRLMPDIVVKQPITGPLAIKFQGCFSKGVVDVVENDQGEPEAHVVNPRLDTMSREVYRHDDLKDLVELQRIRNHFIFSVESVGALPPDVLVAMALQGLRNKCQVILDELAEVQDQPMA
eukprot:m.29005 g.29005  ORF g.29005 m.29005 type:complete len:347 (+) comp11912_c0_seq1:126-1166(+)